MVAHAAEAGDRGPAAPASEAMCRPSRVLCSRSSQVHQRRLGEVVVGEVEVADLGGDHRLVHADSDESRTVSGS